jgi:hypothetical protein
MFFGRKLLTSSDEEDDLAVPAIRFFAHEVN